jgi:hypothetical protein
VDARLIAMAPVELIVDEETLAEADFEAFSFLHDARPIIVPSINSVA